MKRDGGAVLARTEPESPAPHRVEGMRLVGQDRLIRLIEEGRVPDQAILPDRASVEDETAIRAFQCGERAAFDRLVTKYQERVYRICYRFTGSHHDAEEVAQDVFVRVFKGLARFRFESQFSTWLHRVAVNCCLNWVGARKATPAELGENLPDPSPGVLEALSRQEVASSVRRAVQGLPEKQRMTLILRVYHDLTHREIAAALGCPVGTSKANLYFALRNLKKMLTAKGEVSDEGQ